MAEDVATTTGIAHHGATRLPSVDVDSFNLELKDDEGFLGDRASKGAFRNVIDSIRKSVRKAGDDPFGDEPSSEISSAQRVRIPPNSAARTVAAPVGGAPGAGTSWAGITMAA